MKKKINLLIFIFTVMLTAVNAQTPFWISTNYKGAFPVTDNTLPLSN